MRFTNDPKECNLITHAGVFHADDVLSTVILSEILEDPVVMRTFKVPNELPEGAIVYDIGMGQYDHHQPNAQMRENGITYCSFGLLWNSGFGYQYLMKILPDADRVLLAAVVAKSVDKKFVQGVDARDNGQQIPKEVIADFSGLISFYNPSWDSADDENEAFEKACRVTKELLDRICINEYSKARAREEIRFMREANCFMPMSDCPEHVFIMDKFVPWQEYLSELDPDGTIWYVIFPSKRGGWNVQCVPVELGSYEQKAPIPDGWKGHPAACGIDGCTFIHNSGFLSAFKTIEGAKDFAEKAATRHIETMKGLEVIR